MIVDFKEIPPANGTGGEQDKFELFARDLLATLGLKVVSEPGRGNDDRRDLVVQEELIGCISSSAKRFLVSCKHKAHSGHAVGNGEEEDIVGRMREHDCQAFLGFYSTTPSSALVRLFDRLKAQRYEIEIFHQERITQELLNSDQCDRLMQQYFPQSFRSLQAGTIQSECYAHKPIIRCASCGTDILEDFKGAVVFTCDLPTMPRVTKIEFYCQGCMGTQALGAQRYARNIEYYIDPNSFLRMTMEDVKWIWKCPGYMDLSVFRTWNKFTRAMFYFVARRTVRPAPSLRQSIADYIDKYQL